MDYADTTNSHDLYTKMLWDVYNASPIPSFLVNVDGIIENINPAMTALLGYDSEALRDIETFLTLVFPNQEDYKKASILCAKTLNREVQVMAHEVMLTRKDGGRACVELTVLDTAPLNENAASMIVQAIDVTNRHELEKAANDDKMFFLDAVRDMVVFQDKWHRVVWANQAACDAVGLTHESIVGRKCHEIWHDTDDVCDACPVAATVEFGKAYEGFSRTLDGKCWKIRSFPIFEGSEITGVVELATEMPDSEKSAGDQSCHVLDSIIETIPDIVYRLDDQGNITFINEAVGQYGYTVDELMGRSLLDIVHPDDREKAKHRINERRTGARRTYKFELRLMTKNDETLDFEIKSRNVTAPVVLVTAEGLYDGDVADGALFIGTQGIARDVTERKCEEIKVRDREAHVSAILNAYPGMIYICSEDFRIEFMNENYKRWLGHDATGELCYKALGYQHGPCPWCVMDRVSKGETVQYDIRNPRDKRWYSVVSAPVHYEDGSISQQAMIEDITDRKEIEEELRKAKEYAELLFDVTPSAIFTVDNDQRITSWNRKAAEITGYGAGEMIGHSCSEFTDSKCHEKCDLYACGTAGPVEGRECVFRRKDGTEIFVSKNLNVLRDSNAKVIGAIESFDDITENRRIREEQRRLAALIENSSEFIGLTSMDGRVEYINDAGLSLIGFDSLESIKGRMFYEMVPEENLDDLKNVIEPELMREGFWTGERRIRNHKTNALLDVLVNVFLVKSPDDGEPIAIASIMRNITEHNRLRAQLHQAQKMESIGRLAGGIAHDFNNILTAIMGFSDIILTDCGENDTMSGNVKEIKTSAERAAMLTRQLLAFSRKQIIEPRVLDLNVVLNGMQKMLGRLIGEHINFSLDLEDDLWPVIFDTSQIEQVLTNLVINARDAMSQGGCLVIKTSNKVIDGSDEKYSVVSDCGQYVAIKVSDTGTGIDSSVIPHVFEPFFTTKGPGQGSGLGLSTCYGIMKQNNGCIFIDSSPGQGTTVEVIMKRSEHEHIPEEKTISEIAPGGEETLLVVEDEFRVRTLLSRILRDKGYTVLEAFDGVEAERVAHQYGVDQIDLVLTDVIMPRMGGIELAQSLLKEKSDMAVLLVSGFSDESYREIPELADNTGFLSKPFTSSGLSLKVREMLDACKTDTMDTSS